MDNLIHPFPLSLDFSNSFYIVRQVFQEPLKAVVFILLESHVLFVSSASEQPNTTSKATFTKHKIFPKQ